MISFSVYEYDQVDSTNSCLKSLIANNAPEGTVVCAKQQLAGYGRRGNTWVSPEGGLYMSIALRPGNRVNACQLPTLSLVAGLAVRRALCHLLDTQLQSQKQAILLKWPNDVMFFDRQSLEAGKIAGISLEGNASALCLGIGVNVLRNSDTQSACEASGANLAFISDIQDALTITQVREAVLEQLASYYERWLSVPFLTFAEEYRYSNAMEGRVVVAEVNGEVVQGVFKGITEHGHLCLQSTSGRDIEIASGEAHIISFSELEN